jgi:hypothetical protein
MHEFGGEQQHRRQIHAQIQICLGRDRRAQMGRGGDNGFLCFFFYLMIRGDEGGREGREGVDGFKQIKFPLIKQIFQRMEGGLVKKKNFNPSD